MKIWSHRGRLTEQSQHQEDNSLAALEAAFLDPATCGVECDVRVTKDGVPIMMHDNVLPAGKEVSARYVETSTYEEVLAHCAELKQPLPETLYDTLRKLAPRSKDQEWNIEIKSASNAPVVDILTEAMDHGWVKPAQVVLSHFNHAALFEAVDRLRTADAKEREPLDCGERERKPLYVPVRLAPLFVSKEDAGKPVDPLDPEGAPYRAFSATDVAELAKEPYCVALHVPLEGLDMQVVGAANEYGVGVRVWTKNETYPSKNTKQWHAAFKVLRGVENQAETGVITDYPQELEALYTALEANYGKGSTPESGTGKARSEVSAMGEKEPARGGAVVTV